jgi:Family of unknown function (DUF5336)
MSQSNPTPDLKSLPPFDLGVLVTGVLAFIVSFFPYYGAKVSGSVAGVSVSSLGSTSASVSAWHSYSTLGLLLILLGTIVAAVTIFARSSLPDLPVGARWIAAGLCSLGALLYLIRLFTLPSHHENLGAGISASEGVKWGGYLLLIIVLANAACAVISALSSDEQVPWQQASSAGGPSYGGPPIGEPPAAPPVDDAPAYEPPTYEPPATTPPAS